MELKAKQDEDALFEGLLEHVGTDGKFQKRFNLLFNMGFIFTVAMPTFNIILAVTLPSHWCYVPGREHANVTLEEWKSITLPRSNKTSDDAGEPYSKCEMYDVALPLDLSALNETGLNITSCRYGWEYDTTWYAVTAPTQEDWVCEKELYVPNALLFSRIGEVVGTLVFGHLGDTIGRRPTLFLAVVTLVLGRVLTAFTASIYWLFLLANIIGSLPCAAVFQSPLIIGMEVSSAEQRALIAMLQCVGWTAGMCVMPMIAWLTGGNWKIFLVLTSLPCALVFLVHRMFPESPRWLAARGKSKKCVRVLNHIAQLNGTHVPEDAYDLLQKMAGRKEKIYGVASLFSNWRLVRNTLLISISLLLTQIMYYTMVLNVASMSGNPFLNFLLQAMVELPGFLFGRWLCDIVGRRWCQAGSFFVAGVVQFGVIGTVTRADMYTVLIVLVLIVKFCVTVAAYCAYLQCMELYPTCLRQTGTSVGFLAASGLGAIAPYIVYLGTITDLRYPYVILTIMSFLGVICASLLPETLHQKLPETIQEASQFGLDQKFWSLPKAAPKHYEKANTKELNDHIVGQNHKC